MSMLHLTGTRGPLIINKSSDDHRAEVEKLYKIHIKLWNHRNT